MTNIRFSLYRFIWLLLPFCFSSASFSAQPEGVGAAQALNCVINPSVVADLGSGVPGVLHRVRVDRSDFVNAGDVVAVLESGVETAALEIARARAAGVNPQQMNAASGQSQVGKQQDLAQLELLYAQESLKRRTIRSPIAGVVMERFMVAGEHVEDQAVVRVAQIDPLHVEVSVPVDRLGAVRTGMQARVWTESAGSANWQATVDRIDPIADTASGTYGVRLTLANPDRLVPVGLRCRVDFVPEAIVDTVEPQLPTASTLVDSAPRDDEDVIASRPVDAAPTKQGTAAPGLAAKSATEPKPDPVDLVDIEPVAGSLCGWLGPYKNARTARIAARPLRVDGVEVRVVQRPTQKMVGFKIVSPPLYSPAELSTYLRRLRKAGVEDFIPLSKKQGARRVALGVYHGRAPAEQRVEKLEAKGFEVEIGPWYEERKAHWVLVQGDTSLLDPTLAQGLVSTDGENPAPGQCDRMASR